MFSPNRASLDVSWTQRGPSWRRCSLTGGGGAGGRVGAAGHMHGVQAAHCLPRDSMTARGGNILKYETGSSRGRNDKEQQLEKMVEFLK